MMMIKMATVSTITLLLLCCLITSTDSQASCDQYAATGGDLTLILSHKLRNSETLRWKHNDVTVLDRRPNNTYLTGSKEDVSENGSLKLKSLSKNKTGRYTPEVHYQNGEAIPNLKSIQLCILDPVQKPNLTISCSKNTHFTLTCNVSQQSKDNKFKWFQNNKELKDNKTALTRNAETVEKDSFKCEVSNLVSSKTSDPVVQHCYTQKSFLYEELYGIEIWVFIAVGGGVVVLLMIIVIVCCITTRRRKHLQLKDEGELRLAWTNEQQQQHQYAADQQHQQHHHHHHHPHHHQQQPAGHTGPRQHRSKQHRDQQRPRAPDHGHPLPSPRRAAQQAPKPVDNVDDEQPPPLPQPRKKAPKTPRV
ncbi:T-cell surface antigen CD2-like isoform X1 [Micropterus dolomieu]|uniref:T-cell surface antigen CD2-like isoform X1 n=1 Tax=Micropterus dolomieu TaxID=147949 RepID=UPI001E8D7DB6|nr:T-cell surface antigen CD2-like isoform X1 [Micropterus dolomieu]